MIAPLTLSVQAGSSVDGVLEEIRLTPDRENPQKCKGCRSVLRGEHHLRVAGVAHALQFDRAFEPTIARMRVGQSYRFVFAARGSEGFRAARAWLHERPPSDLKNDMHDFLGTVTPPLRMRTLLGGKMARRC